MLLHVLSCILFQLPNCNARRREGILLLVTIIFLGKYLKRISKSLSETTTSFRNFCSCTFIWGNEMAINFRRTVTKGICFRTLFEQKYIEVGTSPGVQDHQCVVRVFFKGPKLRNIIHLKDWGGRIFSF